MIERAGRLTLHGREAVVRRHRTLSPLLPRGHRAYPFAGGWIYLDLRESPMMLARAMRTYEPDKVKALTRLLRPGMTFVDVGSNKGDFALLAARAMGDRGTVHAVEPMPDNCHWIERSVRRNGYAAIRVHELALSDSAGRAQLHIGARSGWHTLVPGVRDESLGSIDVRTAALDELLAGESGTPHADVVKIDVEGAEGAVLRGAEGLLRGTRPLVLLLDLHPPIVDPLEICAVLSSHGLSLRRMDDVSTPLELPTPQLREVVAVRGTI